MFIRCYVAWMKKKKRRLHARFSLLFFFIGRVFEQNLLYAISTLDKNLRKFFATRKKYTPFTCGKNKKIYTDQFFFPFFLIRQLVQQLGDAVDIKFGKPSWKCFFSFLFSRTRKPRGCRMLNALPSFYSNYNFSPRSEHVKPLCELVVVTITVYINLHT